MWWQLNQRVVAAKKFGSTQPYGRKKYWLTAEGAVGVGLLRTPRRDEHVIPHFAEKKVGSPAFQVGSLRSNFPAMR